MDVASMGRTNDGISALRDPGRDATSNAVFVAACGGDFFARVSGIEPTRVLCTPFTRLACASATFFLFFFPRWLCSRALTLSLLESHCSCLSWPPASSFPCEPTCQRAMVLSACHAWQGDRFPTRQIFHHHRFAPWSAYSAQKCHTDRHQNLPLPHHHVF